MPLHAVSEPNEPDVDLDDDDKHIPEPIGDAAASGTPPAESGAWQSVAAAAKLAGVPERTAYNWVRDGRVPQRQDAAGRTLVPVAAVAAAKSLGAARQNGGGSAPAGDGSSMAGGTGGAGDGGLAAPAARRANERQTSASPSPEIQALRDELEQVRLQAEKERLVTELEAARAARLRAARLAREDDLALEEERARRQVEFDSQSRTVALAEQREAEALEAARRAREREREAQARVEREATRRQRWLESWRRGAAQWVRDAGLGPEAVGPAVEAANRVLVGYGPDSDDATVDAEVTDVVTAVTEPFRVAQRRGELERKRAELAERALRRAVPWIEGWGLRPEWTTVATSDELRAVALSAAERVEPDGLGAMERVAEVVREALARAEQAAVDAGADRARREREERERRAWTDIRARALKDPGFWLPRGANAVERDRAGAVLLELVDHRPAELRSEDFEREAEARLAPVRRDIDRRLAVDAVLGWARGVTEANRDRLRELALAAVVRADPRDYAGALRIASEAIEGAIRNERDAGERHGTAA